MLDSTLISRKVLFGNPERASAQISPDGQYLSFLAPLNGVLNIWVAPAHSPEKAKVVTDDKKRGIRSYAWAYTNNHLIYIQDLEGDENWQIFCVDLKDNQTKCLTPYKGIQARIEKASEYFPNEIIISLNKRKAEYHDPYRLNILTGEMVLIYENNEFASFKFDSNLMLRFGFRTIPEGDMQILEKKEDNTWQEFISLSYEETTASSIIGFNKENTALYMFDCRERDTAALYSIDIKTKNRTLLAEDNQADGDDILIHPHEKSVQAFASNYERIHWQFLDKKIEHDFAYLATLESGDIHITSRALDDNFWIVAFEEDNAPLQYYLFDRLQHQATYLFSNRPALEGVKLCKMKPVIIKARDGLNLVSYLTLPLETDPEEKGMPSAPLPLVLYVHGGPHVRDAWGFNAMHQWLANRGYAVLSVNYRASTGFGKAFIKAGNGEWGGRMHDDLIDAANWAINQNIADKAKICIMGGSYGGYATLVGLTFTPDFFACGVDIVGPSSLFTIVKSIPPYWTPLLNMLKIRIGADPDTEEGRQFLESRSPLTYHEKICKPLLIGQGANDPRVKQSESDQIVSALKKKNIPVTYAVYPDEGHGFARPENRMSFYAITEAFLSLILGGKAEPIGNDVQNSSVEIREGEEFIKAHI